MAEDLSSSSCCGSSLTSSIVGLSPDHTSELREAFCLFDHNGDGCIDASELGHVLRSLMQNPTEEELASFMQDMKICGDKISFESFYDSMSSRVERSQMDDEQAMMDAFNALDINGDGKLSYDEIQEILESLGDEISVSDVEQRMVLVDSDRDGFITQHEFIEILTDLWQAMSMKGVKDVQIESCQRIHAWEPCREIIDNSWYLRWKSRAVPKEDVLTHSRLYSDEFNNRRSLAA